MKKVLVTGASGFIGKNLCRRLEQIDQVEVLRLEKSDSILDLSKIIEDADFIYHLAGVNRPINEKDFSTVNRDLTKEIIDLMRSRGKNIPLLITSSTQAEFDNPYGKSKKEAEKIVFDWNRETNNPVYIYRLPGIFGKWCKPNYNSVVATFCNNISKGIPIEISNPDNVITLSYIDDVIDCFIQHLEHNNNNYGSFQKIDCTFELSLAELSERLYKIDSIRKSSIVPNFSDLLNRYLHATFMSYLNVDDFSYQLEKKADNRGWLAEFIKSESFGQIFVSITKPGESRGDHWHNTKIEKFLVLSGKAIISFRNKIDDEAMVSYEVSGEDAKVLDIPVGYVHSIRNIGTSDLITVFWANEIHNQDKPDTIYEKVSTE